jgi:hypothetical protein
MKVRSLALAAIAAVVKQPSPDAARPEKPELIPRKAHPRCGISGHRVTLRHRPKGQLDSCPRPRDSPTVGGASWLGRLPGLPSSTTTHPYSRR